MERARRTAVDAAISAVVGSARNSHERERKGLRKLIKREPRAPDNRYGVRYAAKGDSRRDIAAGSRTGEQGPAGRSSIDIESTPKTERLIECHPIVIPFNISQEALLEEMLKVLLSQYVVLRLRVYSLPYAAWLASRPRARRRLNHMFRSVIDRTKWWRDRLFYALNQSQVMSQRREVIVSGWLQNVRKKQGTLLRKKKFICEEALWVALCVHNDIAPHLEWYPNEDCMFDHRPRQLVDLLEVSLICSVMTDGRMFIIEFKDKSRPAIELCALSPEDCTMWVEGTKNTLSRLNCILDDNDYLPCPTEMSFPSSAESKKSAGGFAQPTTSFDENGLAQRARDALRLDDVASTGPSSPPRVTESNGIAAYEHIARGIALFTRPKPKPPVSSPPSGFSRQSKSIDRPPLPPRESEEHAGMSYSLPVPSRSLYDIPKTSISPKSPYDSFTTKPELPSNEVLLPRKKRLSSTSSDSSVGCATPESGYRQTSLWPPKHRVTFSDDDNEWSSDANNSLYSRPRSCQSEDASTLALELAMKKPRLVYLQLSTCIEHLALVEIDGRVWVAGWTPESNKHLGQVLRVGDEIIEIGEVEVKGIAQVPTLLHTQSIPGNPVSVRVRPVPTGRVCTFVKPLSGPKTLGITLHKKKNRIDAVARNSVMGKGHLPAVMDSYSTEKQYVSSVITDVDDTPMNPFASDEQLVRRLEAIRPGAVFAVTVHPHDFVKLLKTQLKQIKGYKRFIINN
uniref:PH domain-containing protein n=1 Tax=Steinernema glaseri TaxID=37863 RepID=A0A1I7YWR6_9BILA